LPRRMIASPEVGLGRSGAQTSQRNGLDQALRLRHQRSLDPSGARRRRIHWERATEGAAFRSSTILVLASETREETAEGAAVEARRHKVIAPAERIRRGCDAKLSFEPTTKDSAPPELWTQNPRVKQPWGAAKLAIEYRHYLYFGKAANAVKCCRGWEVMSPRGGWTR
jgi:hypothetical protein